MFRAYTSVQILGGKGHLLWPTSGPPAALARQSGTWSTPGLTRSGELGAACRDNLPVCRDGLPTLSGWPPPLPRSEGRGGGSRERGKGLGRVGVYPEKVRRALLTFGDLMVMTTRQVHTSNVFCTLLVCIRRAWRGFSPRGSMYPTKLGTASTMWSCWLRFWLLNWRVLSSGSVSAVVTRVRFLTTNRQ